MKTTLRLIVWPLICWGVLCLMAWAFSCNTSKVNKSVEKVKYDSSYTDKSKSETKQSLDSVSETKTVEKEQTLSYNDFQWWYFPEGTGDTLRANGVTVSPNKPVYMGKGNSKEIKEKATERADSVGLSKEEINKMESDKRGEVNNNSRSVQKDKKTSRTPWAVIGLLGLLAVCVFLGYFKK